MNRQTADQQNQEPRHSIAVVSNRTGLTQLVLRAWERRYAAVVPARTDTGRRLYTDRDLEKLTLLRMLTESGHRIGDVAGSSIDELQKLMDEVAPRPQAPAFQPTGKENVEDLLEEALTAIAEMDASGLEGLLARASVALSRPALRNGFLRPLIAEIGHRWSDGTLRIAHEHMSSAIIRTFLSTTQNPLESASTTAPMLIVTTPSGQRHELGAMLALAAVREAGWNTLYLGPDLPAEEIAGAALKQDARGVLLSLVYPAADPATADQLRRLRSLVGIDLPILVGGQASGSYAGVLDEIDAVRVEDEAELLEMLTRTIRL